MLNAHIANLSMAHDGTILVTAICQGCRKTVMHGAGADLDDLVLGHRVAHCGDGSYTLADPHSIVPARVAVLRAEQAEKVARQARRARPDRRPLTTPPV
jgi:hypothetical protein